MRILIVESQTVYFCTSLYFKSGCLVETYTLFAVLRLNVIWNNFNRSRIACPNCFRILCIISQFQITLAPGIYFGPVSFRNNRNFHSPCTECWSHHRPMHVHSFCMPTWRLHLRCDYLNWTINKCARQTFFSCTLNEILKFLSLLPKFVRWLAMASPPSRPTHTWNDMWFASQNNWEKIALRIAIFIYQISINWIVAVDVREFCCHLLGIHAAQHAVHGPNRQYRKNVKSNPEFEVVSFFHFSFGTTGTYFSIFLDTMFATYSLSRANCSDSTSSTQLTPLIR